jgi:hydroxyacylglutathione hydrolase
LSWSQILGKISGSESYHGHGEAAYSLNEMRRRRDESLNYIHVLREAVAAEEQGTIDRLITGCAFPRNMIKFHQSNQKLFQSELTKDKGNAR